MIIDFSIQNFGSIKDTITLSFEADKSKHLENYYVIQKGKYRLLKLGLIYGSNAAGKTTILNALTFLRELVLEPKTQKNETFSYKPFLFDEQTRNQDSKLCLNFIQNDESYYYELYFNQQAIVSEKLCKGSQKKPIYERTTNLSTQFTSITFTNKKNIPETSIQTLETNTLWNNTVLGGFSRTNIDSIDLKEVTDWFKNYLKPMIHSRTNLESFVTSRIENVEINKTTVVTMLQRADFNISDVIIKKEEQIIPDGLLEFLEKEVKASESKIKEIKEKGVIEKIRIEFEHTVGNKQYLLNFGDESQGTQRYYGFAGILTLLLKQSVAFPVDELESSLHPDLFTHFLLCFLVNSKNSQLIATTHNREILNNKDIFRNDAIWIANKTEFSTTELYSLADFDSSVIRDTSNIYNAYKAGKLGGIPSLGDYYLDIE